MIPGNFLNKFSIYLYKINCFVFFEQSEKAVYF